MISVAALLVATSGCSQIMAVEVLPPRKSATCSSPSVNSNASGRGLLDVNATETLHGAYVGDLRIAASGDVLVDGILLTFEAPEDASSSTTEAATEASGEQPLGDLLLDGTDDELRQAVVEDVELLPRTLALAMREDGDLGLSETEFGTVIVTIQPTQNGNAIMGASGTYRIDVCKGCLVTAPADEDCDNSIAENNACRPGQDVELYSCAAAPSGGIF